MKIVLYTEETNGEKKFVVFKKYMPIRDREELGMFIAEVRAILRDLQDIWDSYVEGETNRKENNGKEESQT